MKAEPPTRPLAEWLSGDHDAEMRVMCAEETGWENISIHQLERDHPNDRNDWPHGDFEWRKNAEIPDYLESLDACAELRAALKTKEEQYLFLSHLGGVFEEEAETPVDPLWIILNATPRQITLAFLLTRGRVAIS